MTRDEAVSSLKKALWIEKALELYARHVQNTLYLSGLKPETRDKVKETLNMLNRESRESVQLLARLVEEAKDVHP